MSDTLVEVEIVIGFSGGVSGCDSEASSTLTLVRLRSLRVAFQTRLLRSSWGH